MSMLSKQADELRTLAGGMRKLYENSANLTRVQVAGLTTAVDAMREAADTIESLRDKLQEMQGVGGESNYTRLFGTPERTARTVLSLDYCCEDCDKCPAFEICGLHSKFGRTVYGMTEWLRGDA